MTVKEKYAEWIKQRRKRMMTAISELAGILTASNFDKTPLRKDEGSTDSDAPQTPGMILNYIR